MRKSNAILATYFILVFLVGGVLGALAFRLYTVKAVSAKSTRRTPEEYRRRYVEEMTTRLKLDPAQLQKLNGVLDQTRDEFRNVHEKYQPEMHAIQEKQTSLINGFLNENQKQEYLKMRQERELKMKQTRSKAPGC